MFKNSLKAHPIETILVGLDLSEMDETLIKYASFFCHQLPIKEVYFYHVAKNLDFPKDIPEEYLHVLANVDEGIKNDIEKNIKAWFKKPKNTKVTIKVKEGNPIDKMVRYVKIKNIDMVILGRKIDLKGSGLMSSSVARKSPCHLLLVPEKHQNPRLDKIMVPIDFSKHSMLAIQYALILAKNAEKNIHYTHIYSVPLGYSKSGKSFEEFSDIMLQNAKKSFDDFLGQQHPIPCDFHLAKSEHPAFSTIELKNKIHPDLVIIGSKGRSNLATVFLGSFAEKFMIHNPDTPLLIVKKRNENMGVLDALMNI